MNSLKYPLYAIGIDIGGTKIAGALFYYENSTDMPKIVYKLKIASEARKGKDFLIKNICKCADGLIDQAYKIDKSCSIFSIGLGCPGRIDKFTGEVMTATDVFPGFLHTKLSIVVSEHTKVKSFALNDAQAHTYGEYKWGAGRGIDNFVLVAIGTGIGGSVVVNGQLMLGSRGFAGELGHAQCYLAAGYACNCGKIGHLESVASGSGIERTYKINTGKELTGPEITKLAYEGDKHAINSLELAGRTLGQGIADYFSIFDPDFIILTGSVVNAGKIWRDSVLKGIDEELLDEIKDKLTIVDAKLGNDAAFIGACQYGIDRLTSRI